MNVAGSTVKEVSSSTQKISLDLGDLAAGTYLLKATTADKVYSHTLQLTGN